MLVGSDARARAPPTRRIQYLEEGDVAFLTRDGARVVDAHDHEVERPIRQTALSGALIGKGNHRHFMEKEMWEQPSVLGDTLQAYVNPLTRSVTLPPMPFDWRSLPKLTIVGCGTAY